MINIESEDPFDQVGRCHSLRVVIRKRFFGPNDLYRAFDCQQIQEYLRC